MITRRDLLKTVCALPFIAFLREVGYAENITEFPQLKAGYARRLKKILVQGALPYIDIESSCNSNKVDIDFIAKNLDRLNIGLMALSADINEKQFERGARFDNLSAELIANYPDRFIPVGNGGRPPALTSNDFLDAQEAAARKKQIMLMGEFEFRHYPSPRQAKRGETDRDVRIPVDGLTGHHVFSLSERTGMAFQIHYVSNARTSVTRF